MSTPAIEWNGLTLGGDGPYRIRSIEGWSDLPGVRNGNADRARTHGEHQGLQLAGGRTVTVAGVISDTVNLDALVLQLEDATIVDADQLATLQITDLGRTLTAQASILRRSIPRELATARMATWAVQWQSPDPLRYGLEQNPQPATGLPITGGGIVYPLAYPIDYGTPGDNGQLVLDNPGTADAPVVFTVTGPLPAGFEISASGQRIVYPLAVPAGQVIEIDTGRGSVLLEGTADRRAALAWADWMQIPKKGSLTVQFASLGGTPDPAAQMTAQWRAAYW